MYEMNKAIRWLTLLALSGIAGCATPRMPEMKSAIGVPDGQINYPPVSTRGMALLMPGKTTFTAGEKTAVTLSVANNGQKAVTIAEWYSNESDNLIIMVQPWLTGMKEPDPDNWIELSFDLKKPVMHYPMTLLPGNRAMVSKELPFIEKLQVSPGMARRFFIKAKTNLKSLPLESEVISIQVVSKKPKKER